MVQTWVQRGVSKSRQLADEWSWRTGLRRVRGQRALPSCVIIGEARCGTTSLFADLAEHPQIVTAARKEVHFFDLRYRWGTAWYAAQFPPVAEMPVGGMTLEASPFYLVHPLVLPRMQAVLPAAKVIVLLRDPVARAWSHYQLSWSLRRERRTFERAIEEEPARVTAAYARLAADPSADVPELQRAYIARGIYVDALARWLSAWDPSRVLVLESERYFREPAAVYRRVLDFLELPSVVPTTFERRNTSAARIDRAAVETPPAPRAETLPALRAFYMPHNARLTGLLGQSFSWT